MVSGKTPLMHHAAIGDEGRVQRLLARGADIHAVDAEGDGVLRYAMGTTNARLFELLLARGADSNAPSTSATGVPGFTILHAIAEMGWSDGIAALSRYGANVDARGVGGITATMLAAGGGRDDAIATLYSLGANLNALDDDGDSALYYATSKGHWATTKLLLSLGANVEHPKTALTRNPLFVAAVLTGAESRRPPGSSASDFTQIVIELLRAGADPSAMYDAGYALFRPADGGIEIAPADHVARVVTSHNDWAVCHVTPEGRARFNNGVPAPEAKYDPQAVRARLTREYSSFDTAREKQRSFDSRSLSGELYAAVGMYGLHYAKTGAEVALLLSDGAPIDGVALIEYGDDIQHWETPLLTAFVDGRLEVADRLISSGADVDAPNGAFFQYGGGFGHSALHMLIQRRDYIGTQRLIAAGADVNRQTTLGSTPLYFAASIDDPELVRILLEAGARPQVRDLKGGLPVEIAGPMTRHLLA